MARYCLSLQKKRSTRLRSRYKAKSVLRGSRRLAFGGRSPSRTRPGLDPVARYHSHADVYARYAAPQASEPDCPGLSAGQRRYDRRGLQLRTAAHESRQGDKLMERFRLGVVYFAFFSRKHRLRTIYPAITLCSCRLGAHGRGRSIADQRVSAGDVGAHAGLAVLSGRSSALGAR